MILLKKIICKRFDKQIISLMHIHISRGLLQNGNILHNYDGNNVCIVVNACILQMACGEIYKFNTAYYVEPSPVIIRLFLEL